LPLADPGACGVFEIGAGDVLEEEIDSSLGFPPLRLPGGGLLGTSEALPPGAERAAGPEDDGGEARQRADTERKIMLGVQLYDLIAKAGMDPQQVVAFYSFMTQLGMARRRSISSTS
jgi:hypothetical protein